MFEKDAKKYVNEHSEYNETFDMVFVNCDTEKAFKDGAEFGYNKCFEQIRKLVNEHTRLDCIISELLRLQEKEGK